ncbi:MAG: glutaminyl-peptide cyclotransferase [Bdellovibrionales bacterium]|nr:glutaminyl-peptide cyclotransferase [Oligoflexia bacterium]
MKKSMLVSGAFFLLSACGDPDTASAPSLRSEVLPITAGSYPQPSASPTPVAAFTPAPIPSASPSAPAPFACGATPFVFKISRTILRSTNGLTEGLSWVDGKLFESTGSIAGHGASVLNAIDPGTGKVTFLHNTPSRSFGEGLVKLGNYFYQLTYTEREIYKYTSDGTANGTRQVGTYSSPLSEGWGLTTDGVDLIASDGSSNIYRLDPNDLSIKSQFKVFNPKGRTISGMNELEYVDGQIYANLFPTDRMIRFDARSGCQTGEIDLSTLPSNFNCANYPASCTRDSVTNGVAYDPVGRIFYLTGKSWPHLFEGQFE